jgi:hypothetical protein
MSKYGSERSFVWLFARKYVTTSKFELFVPQMNLHAYLSSAFYHMPIRKMLEAIAFLPMTETLIMILHSFFHLYDFTPTILKRSRSLPLLCYEQLMMLNMM